MTPFIVESFLKRYASKRDLSAIVGYYRPKHYATAMSKHYTMPVDEVFVDQVMYDLSMSNWCTLDYKGDMYELTLRKNLMFGSNTYAFTPVTDI